MNSSGDIGELAQSLTIFQSQIQTVQKDSAGYGYRYASLAAVAREVYGPMCEVGLSISQVLDCTPTGTPALTTVLMHKSGQWLSGSYPLEPAGMKGVNSAQQFGAAISYARRYGLCAVLGLATEDDDGASLPKTNGERPQGRPSSQSVPEPQRGDSEPLGVSHGGTPACPECGKQMRKRNGSKGEFWGCQGYPDCRGTMNVDDAEPRPVANRNAWIDAKLSSLGIDREEFKRFLQKMRRLVAPPGERLSFDHVSDEVMDELRDPATWDKAIAKFNTTMDIAEDDIPF